MITGLKKYANAPVSFVTINDYLMEDYTANKTKMLSNRNGFLHNGPELAKYFVHKTQKRLKIYNKDKTISVLFLLTVQKPNKVAFT